MKKLILFCLALGLASFPSFAQAQTTAPIVYGKSFNQGPGLTPMRLSVAVKRDQNLNNVCMLGWVTEVDAQNGEWLKVATTKDSHDAVLVKIKDHAFSVNQDFVGKQVLVNGDVEQNGQAVTSKDPGSNSVAKVNPNAGYVFMATGLKVRR